MSLYNSLSPCFLRNLLLLPGDIVFIPLRLLRPMIALFRIRLVESVSDMEAFSQSNVLLVVTPKIVTAIFENNFMKCVITEKRNNKTCSENAIITELI